MLDMQRIYSLLQAARWFRQISAVGSFSLGCYCYNVTTQFADQTDDPEIRQTLTEFGRDSERHRDMVVELTAELGARPSAVREPTSLGAAWTSGLAAIPGHGAHGDFFDLQSLLSTEYDDRFHWYTLKTIADASHDDRLAQAVAQALPDEEKHVSYLERKARDLARLTMGMA